MTWATGKLKQLSQTPALIRARHCGGGMASGPHCFGFLVSTPYLQELEGVHSRLLHCIGYESRMFTSVARP